MGFSKFFFFFQDFGTVLHYDFVLKKRSETVIPYITSLFFVDIIDVFFLPLFLIYFPSVRRAVNLNPPNAATL